MVKWAWRISYLHHKVSLLLPNKHKKPQLKVSFKNCTPAVFSWAWHTQWIMGQAVRDPTSGSFQEEDKLWDHLAVPLCLAFEGCRDWIGTVLSRLSWRWQMEKSRSVCVLLNVQNIMEVEDHILRHTWQSLSPVYSGSSASHSAVQSSFQPETFTETTLRSDCLI